jgi:1,4-alpha-glucan branching enzyme
LARPPLTVAPYDAELFGHWWFEGPLFLAALDRELDACPDLEAVTLGQHLERHGCAAACRVAASTWGEAGYNGTWLRPETAWVHLQLRQAAEEFQDLRRRYGRRPAASPAGRFLRQAARSLLLAQGSDWTFHLGRGGSDYAGRHLRAQLARFACLADALGRCGDGGEGPDGGGDLTVLETLERLDALFPELNPDHFAMEQGLSL